MVSTPSPRASNGLTDARLRAARSAARSAAPSTAVAAQQRFMRTWLSPRSNDLSTGLGTPVPDALVGSSNSGAPGAPGTPGTSGTSGLLLLLPLSLLLDVIRLIWVQFVVLEPDPFLWPKQLIRMTTISHLLATNDTVTLLDRHPSPNAKGETSSLTARTKMIPVPPPLPSLVSPLGPFSTMTGSSP